MGPAALIAGGGLLSSILGKPKMPGDLRRLLKMQVRIARQLEANSKSMPMGDPMERAALAQQQGLLGEQQRMQQQNLFAMAGTGQPGMAQDMVGNLGAEQMGQRMALDSQHLLHALATRRQSLLDAASVARGGVAGMPQQPQGGDVSALFGNLAQMITYRQAMKQGQAGPVPGAGTQIYDPRSGGGQATPNPNAAYAGYNWDQV